MGQAKRRGTYQDRRALAIEKAAIEREEARKLKAAKEAAMTKEERQKRRDSEIAFANMLGACLSIGTLPYSIKRSKSW